VDINARCRRHGASTELTSSRSTRSPVLPDPCIQDYVSPATATRMRCVLTCMLPCAVGGRAAVPAGGVAGHARPGAGRAAAGGRPDSAAGPPLPTAAQRCAVLGLMRRSADTCTADRRRHSCHALLFESWNCVICIAVTTCRRLLLGALHPAFQFLLGEHSAGRVGHFGLA